jgi:hypothetical protein
MKLTSWVVGLFALVAWCGAASANDKFALDLDGQLERLAAELPCPFAADTWKISNAPPSPERVPCTWTAQTYAPTRALWIAALDQATRVALAALRADATRYAGLPFVFSGHVRAARPDLLYRAHIWLTVADGQEIEAVSNDYGLVLHAGDAADVVGYLAGWSQQSHERVPLIAVADLVAAGEVARIVESWRRRISAGDR